MARNAEYRRIPEDFEVEAIIPNSYYSMRGFEEFWFRCYYALGGAIDESDLKRLNLHPYIWLSGEVETKTPNEYGFVLEATERDGTVLDCLYISYLHPENDLNEGSLLLQSAHEKSGVDCQIRDERYMSHIVSLHAMYWNIVKNGRF